MSTVNAARDPAASPADLQHSSAQRGSDRRNEDSRALLLRRVLSEFREMPCMRLTEDQAQRLFGLRADVSARIIETLIRQGHLRLDADGRYAATDAG